jgi:hypothetical protein
MLISCVIEGHSCGKVNVMVEKDKHTLAKQIEAHEQLYNAFSDYLGPDQSMPRHVELNEPFVRIDSNHPIHQSVRLVESFEEVRPDDTRSPPIEGRKLWIALRMRKDDSGIYESGLDLQRWVEEQLYQLRGKYHSMGEQSGLTAGECESQKSNKKKQLKSPSKDAFDAYRLSMRTGKKQQELARILTLELNKPVSQGQVSKWLKQVTTWVEAGDMSSDIGKSVPQIDTVDPDVIDRGPRQDAHTPRQREKFEADD